LTHSCPLGVLFGVCFAVMVLTDLIINNAAASIARRVGQVHDGDRAVALRSGTQVDQGQGKVFRRRVSW